MPRVFSRRGWLAVGALVGAIACAGAGRTGGAPVDGMKWVASWEGPPQLTEPRNMPPAPGVSSRAIRQIIHVTLGGTRWRFKFSNAFGNGP